MKTILLIAVAAFLSVSAFAQGTVNFDLRPLSLRTADGYPIPVDGTIYGALFYAPEPGVRDENVFVQAGEAVSPGPLPGWLYGGSRALDGVPWGGVASVQVRLWDTANPNHVGASTIIDIGTLDIFSYPFTLPVSLVAAGMTAFQMQIIPEPSVFALGGIGAGALLLAYRRNSDRP